jgi:hypothetical protein
MVTSLCSPVCPLAFALFCHTRLLLHLGQFLIKLLPVHAADTDTLLTVDCSSHESKRALPVEHEESRQDQPPAEQQASAFSLVNKVLVGRRSRPWLKTPVLRVQVGEPPQGPQAGHEAVLAAAVDHEAGQLGEAPADRLLRDGEPSGPIVRPDQRVHLGGRAEERAIVDPLRLDELELPGQVRSKELLLPGYSSACHTVPGQVRAGSLLPGRSPSPDHPHI